MSFLKVEDKKKWLNAFVALSAGISGYVFYRFFLQLSDWFELEAKVKNFVILAQVVALIIGVVTLIIVFKHKRAMEYLNEVYNELVKVVWPDRDSSLKLTVGIVIGIAITSGIFVLVDLFFQWLLAKVY
jgi:preprotein translocase subunit SecE